jgi:hypothetical protein
MLARNHAFTDKLQNTLKTYMNPLSPNCCRNQSRAMCQGPQCIENHATLSLVPDCYVLHRLCCVPGASLLAAHQSLSAGSTFSPQPKGKPYLQPAHPTLHLIATISYSNCS